MSDAQNKALMISIREKWGVEIMTACESSSVPPSFLAALIANESGGDPNAKRFERNVLISLWNLLQGRSPAYGSIRRDDVFDYIAAPDSKLTEISSAGFRVLISNALQQLDSLATSWGLTQVMGYEALPFASREFWKDPEGSLRISLRMLGDFAEHFGLDLKNDSAQLFDCWNTGRPHRPTADPKYIPNGLMRMAIYQELLDGPPKSVSA